MLAHAFLAVATADQRDRIPVPDGLIMLTVNEFRRLFDTLLLDHPQAMLRIAQFADQRGITDRARTPCHESWSDGRYVAVNAKGDVPPSNWAMFYLLNGPVST